MALDAAFENVAFAGGDVLDPETGELAVGEDEVMRVAAEAASERFAGLSTYQVFGAVSVAAVRASNSGLLDALGNDPVLNSMSMSEQELEQTLEYMKTGSKNAIAFLDPCSLLPVDLIRDFKRAYDVVILRIRRDDPFLWWPYLLSGLGGCRDHIALVYPAAYSSF